MRRKTDVHGNAKRVIMSHSATQFYRALGRGGFSPIHAMVIDEAFGVGTSEQQIRSAVAQGKANPYVAHAKLREEEWEFLAAVAYGQRVVVKDIPGSLEDEHREHYKRWSAAKSPAFQQLKEWEDEQGRRPTVIPEGIKALSQFRQRTHGAKKGVSENA